MKKHVLFIGIDISKETLDASVMQGEDQSVLYHQVYSNNKAGIKQVIIDLKKKTKSDTDHWLFCMEHTGVYAMPLCVYLEESGVDYALVPALEIKNSTGIKRGKNDKSDSLQIARYACLNDVKIRPYQLPAKALIRLKILLSFRDRLVRAKQTFASTSKEHEAFMEKSVINDMVKETKSLIDVLNKKIEKLDKLIQELINADETLCKTYKLATSVPGIGPQTACFLIVYTCCFTSFNDARKLACYAGVAPFEYSSGKSIRGKSKVSHLANGKLKSLLSLAALNAKRTDKELNLYYERKTKEGKNGMLVMNAIRDKLIHRVFATVKRGTPYVPLMKFAA
jgi:transposase